MGRNPIFSLASLRGHLSQQRKAASAPRARARSLCIVSGKGGTGKSVVSASVARVLARSARTLLIDADLGVGNAHILQGVTPKATLGDLFHGCQPRHLVERAPGGLDLVCGGSGVARLASVSCLDLARIGDALVELEYEYDYLLADCGAGISQATINFARGADRVLVVTTPDLTAMTDAYAFLKVLGVPASGPAPMLLVNRAKDADTAHETAERVAGVARKFLGRAPEILGWIPADPDVTVSVNARTPLVEHNPSAPAAKALAGIATQLRERLDSSYPGGLGRYLATTPTAAQA